MIGNVSNLVVFKFYFAVFLITFKIVHAIQGNQND